MMKCGNCRGWMCGMKGWLSNILWVLSLVALGMAWIASARPTGVFLQLPVAHLFWDALILGVLAIGARSMCSRGGHGASCVCTDCGSEEGDDEGMDMEMHDEDAEEKRGGAMSMKNMMMKRRQ